MAKTKSAGVEKLAKAALAGGAVASVLNIIVLLFSRMIDQVPYRGLADALTPVEVVVACFVAAISAVVLLWALRMFTKKSADIFYAVVAILLVVGIAEPLMRDFRDLGRTLVLAFMYLVCAGSIIGFLQRMGGLKK